MGVLGPKVRIIGIVQALIQEAFDNGRKLLRGAISRPKDYTFDARSSIMGRRETTAPITLKFYASMSTSLMMR